MKKGFTLAEVLITLGIIGVVAALTIPALVGKYQEKVLKTQFKKMYATINTALQKTYFDLGEQQTCGYYDTEGEVQKEGADCMDFLDEFAKNMGVIKTCRGNAFADGCVPDYSDTDFSSSGGCGWFRGTHIKNGNIVYVFKDGSIIVPYSDAPRNHGHGLLGFDVNGMKGPNKPGYDFFAINMVIDGPRLRLGWPGTDFNIQNCLPYPYLKWKRISDIMD
jgi:prepilin-type N-terminal cleavage/methylation domain-containing protein